MLHNFKGLDMCCTMKCPYRGHICVRLKLVPMNADSFSIKWRILCLNNNKFSRPYPTFLAWMFSSWEWGSLPLQREQEKTAVQCPLQQKVYSFIAKPSTWLTRAMEKNPKPKSTTWLPSLQCNFGTWDRQCTQDAYCFVSYMSKSQSANNGAVQHGGPPMWTQKPVHPSYVQYLTNIFDWDIPQVKQCRAKKK